MLHEPIYIEREREGNGEEAAQESRLLMQLPST